MVMRRPLWNLWLLASAVTFILFSSEGKIVSSKSVEGGKTEDRSHGENSKDDFIGYVAEWEYEASRGEEEETFDLNEYTNKQLSPLATTKTITRRNGEEGFPSSRVGPGSYQDATGSWWLFGGQGLYSDNQASERQDKGTNTSIQFLSDLWVYDTQEEPTKWKQIFSTQKLNKKIQISSYPSNLAFPLLCGNSAASQATVFGYANGIKGFQQELPLSPNSLFTDDNIVWVFDIPKEGHQKFPFSNETSDNQGVWTSYICCDACLPDDNTTLEFCPRFVEVVKDVEPILWCSQDSVMALQLNPTSLHKSSGESETKSVEVRSTLENHIGHGNKVGTTNPPNSNAIGHKIPSDNGFSKSKSKNEEPDVIPEIDLQKRLTTGGRETLNLWRFDLRKTEWKKLKGVTLPSAEIKYQIFSPKCRSVSDQIMVYILCPPYQEKKTDSLLRDVFVFNPERNSVDWLSQLKLNNVFRDKRIWQLGRSTLHALRIHNQTIIFLAYQKLLDLWIHEHPTGRLTPVENVWRGSTLHKFQTWSSFYKLRITVPFEKEKSSYNVFMPNPRSKLFTFDDPKPLNPTSFHITIVTDQSVFLPSRDASFLINPEDQVSKSSNASPTPNQGGRESSLTSNAKSTSPLSPLSLKTNLISSLNLTTTPRTRTSPISITGQGQTNVIDARDGGSFESAMTTKKVIPNAENTTDDPVTRQLSGMKSHLYNDNTSFTLSGERRWNASSSGRANSTTFTGEDTSTTVLKSSITEGIASAHPSPPTHASHEDLSKHLLGIKRSFIKGTIDPPKLEDSTSSTVNNEKSRSNSGGVGKALEKKNPDRTSKTMTIHAPRVANRSFSSIDNRQKLVQSAKVKNISQKAQHFQEQAIALEIKNRGFAHENPGENPLTNTNANIQNQNYSSKDSGVTMEKRPRGTMIYPFYEVEPNDTREEIESSGNGGRRSPLTYRSEDKVDPSTVAREADGGDLGGIVGSTNDTSTTPYSTMLFFAISISFFATIGIVLFFRSCVKCPPSSRRQSVLLKEPPPIRYSVIPDELSYHTPIV